MSVRDEFVPYKDSFGLVHPSPPSTNGISQNGPRFTGEYLQCEENHGEIDSTIIAQLRMALLACQEPLGNLRRHPNSLEQQSVDDTMAALYWAPKVGSPFAEDWLLFGRKYAPKECAEPKLDNWWGRIVWRLLKTTKLHRYTYNTEDPTKWTLAAWIGRQQQIVAHAQIMAGERVPFLRKLWWTVVVGILAVKKAKHDQDAWVLTWYLVKAARQHPSLMIQWARRKWISKFKTTWPEGLGEVLADYMGPTHPSTKWLRGEFGE